MKSLRYIPALNSITGGINASLLMGQLEYWFEKTEGKAFYKFTEPCEASHYQVKDSWCEELGFSKAEFRTAFTKIGKVYKSKKAYLESKDKFEGKYYLSYYDRIKHMTYYVRNEEKVKALYTQIKSLNLGVERVESTRQEASEVELESAHHLPAHEHKEDLQEAIPKRFPNPHSASPISIDYIQTLHSEIKESLAHEEVLEMYHRICKELPPVQLVTTKLKEQINQFVYRISQKGYTVQQILEKVASSDFLSGRLWRSRWKASLEWIMKGERYLEILADKYRNTESSGQAHQINKQSRFHKIASHQWDFEKLERLEQEYIEKKLKTMIVGTNPLLSRVSLSSST